MDTAEILKRFERHADGHWVCLHDLTIETPRGPLGVRAGEVFAFGDRSHGIDVAEFLEQLGAQFGS